jgi:hypothetical protein
MHIVAKILLYVGLLLATDTIGKSEQLGGLAAMFSLNHGMSDMIRMTDTTKRNEAAPATKELIFYEKDAIDPRDDDTAHLDQWLDSQQQQQQQPTSHQKVHHHLKWLSNQTVYPIAFEKVDNMETEFNWWKHSSNKYVNQLADYFDSYVIDQPMYKTRMFILKYDNYNHDQLSSYEPKVVGMQQQQQQQHQSHEHEQPESLSHLQHDRDIFTLVYMLDHKLKLVYDKHSVNVTCYADFLVPQNKEDSINQAVLREMERGALFKLTYKSNNNYERMANQAKFESVHSKYNKLMIDSRREQQRQQQQQLQQQQQHMNLNRPSTYPSFFYQAQPMPSINHNMFQIAPPIAYRTPVLMRLKRDAAVKRTQQKHKRRFTRNKRQAAQILISNQHNMAGSFMEVRLGTRPITLYKPFDNSEEINCRLDLLNKDNVNLDHYSNIYAILGVDESTDDSAAGVNPYDYHDIHSNDELDKKPNEWVDWAQTTSHEATKKAHAVQHESNEEAVAAEVSTTSTEAIHIEVEVEGDSKHTTSKAKSDESVEELKKELLTLIDGPRQNKPEQKQEKPIEQHLTSASLGEPKSKSCLFLFTLVAFLLATRV